MPKTIICDTSCFIVLTNIGNLDLLQKVYGQIVTTPEVASEYGESLPDWIIIEQAVNIQMQQLLELQLDKGESSAIALALETLECTIILDDLKARKIAERLGLDITGTVGIIIKAKLKGIIPSIKPMIDKIKATDFRVSEDIEKQAMIVAGE
jgi:predicted nucleic acid-binding protein